MRLLDSHLHLWDPKNLSYPWLSGSLDAVFAQQEIFEELIDDADDEAAIFVQADCIPEQYLDEVKWVESIADQAGVAAIVAGAQLDQGDQTVSHLDALLEHESVVGVRHLLQGGPDNLVLSPEFIAGAREVARRGYTFDACVRGVQIPAVTRLAEEVPDLPIVLDHLGKPAIGTEESPLLPSEDWIRDIKALAAHPQVYCKLSGLPAEAQGQWIDDQVIPFFDVVADAFGPERLMWGSDWPVSSIDFTADEYVAQERSWWLGTVMEWSDSRGYNTDDIVWENAARFYRIN